MRRVAALFFMLFTALSLQAQNADSKDVPFNGQIVDANDKPIKKAEVWITDSKKRIKTNKKGQFGLLNVNSGDTLKVFITNRVYFVPIGDKKSMLIHLMGEGVRAEESKELADMGFGLVKKSTSSRSSNHFTGEELRQTGETGLLDALKGMVPGLNVSSTYIGSNESASFGGPSSLHASSAPVYVVDGNVVQSLSGMSVYQIDYVEITKDASMYGARGASGAIIVKTLGAGN